MADRVDVAAGVALDKEALRLHRALDGGIDRSMEANGYELLGLSFKINAGDVLCTLRLSNHKGAFVSFVGSTDVAKCVLKVHREARAGTLRYREDRFGG